MSKPLSIAGVVRQHAKSFGDLKRVTLSSGHYFEVHQSFKPTAIRQLLIDYRDILERFKDKEMDENTVKDLSFVYYMLLLKHFSNLDKIPAEIGKMVSVCEKLFDLGILEEMLTALPVEEMKKIDEMIAKITTETESLERQLQEQKDAQTEGGR